MHVIRGLLAILLSVAVFLPISAHAQTRASSYEFAPSTHQSVDKDTSMVGHVFDNVDTFLDYFRDSRGVMMFIVAGGLAVMAYIAGMPFAAILIGIFAGFILLLNKPLLLGILLVPIYLLHKKSQEKKREELKLAVVPKPNETAESLAIRQARKIRKIQKKNGTLPRKSGSRSNITARAS